MKLISVVALVFLGLTALAPRGSSLPSPTCDGFPCQYGEQCTMVDPDPLCTDNCAPHPECGTPSDPPNLPTTCDGFPCQFGEQCTMVDPDPLCTDNCAPHPECGGSSLPATCDGFPCQFDQQCTLVNDDPECTSNCAQHPECS